MIKVEEIQVNVSCSHPEKCFAFMRQIKFEKNKHGTLFYEFQCPDCEKKVTVSIASKGLWQVLE